MAISKQYLKSKPICKVTFSVAAEEAKKVAVVGDFNNWDPKANTLKKLKNGSFKGAIDFPKDSTYEFKYLIDGEFANEQEGDGLQWNEYAGTENSILKV